MRPDASLMGVLSGLEIALWDICGKAVEKPVYELLGGKVHEKLRTYTYLYPKTGSAYTDESPSVYDDPDLAAEAASECVAQGFTAIKFDPAGPYSVFDPRQPSMEAMDRSELFCSRIREAVGSKADLLFGTHGQFPLQEQSGLHDVWRHMILFGLRNQLLRRGLKKWQKLHVRLKYLLPLVKD
ncbi:MAG: hypothetical protein Ct9H300mP28_22520 [Pseudomonadota bacterium]|nr:MAG: hypothetical protein Ct9H300mP28_22520 [Pseudomonadota bacterium]